MVGRLVSLYICAIINSKIKIMKYQIEYGGTTGDSETTSRLSGVLELEWENLEVAKANLKRIADHYEFYKILNDVWSKVRGLRKSNQEIIGENTDKDWISLKKNGNEYDEHQAMTCIRLYTDVGKVWQIRAPWCGHFEMLESVEIVTVESDMKIIF